MKVRDGVRTPPGAAFSPPERMCIYGAGAKGGEAVKSYATENIRNIVLVGHGGSGKTSLAEAMLHLSGATTRVGKIAEGNTVSDFDEDEIRRQISVVSAVEGVEVQTSVAWNYARELSLPRMILVNKVDRENASFRRTLDQMRELWGKSVAPLSLPLGREHEFRGIISVVDDEALEYDDKGRPSHAEVPEERKARLDEVRTDLLDSIAETSDELLERYLEGGEITRDEIVSAIHTGVDDATMFPVMVGSATRFIGVDRLCDVIVKAGPSPLERPPVESVEGEVREPKPDGPMSALIFKTLSDPYVGKVSFFKVVSGKLTGEGSIHNASKNTDERIAHVFTMRGKNQERLDKVVAGDIGAVAKLADATTGDTLSDKSSPVVFPGIEPPEPLLPKAIAPKTKGDEDKLMIGLQRLIEEDPSLRLERNDETQQTILWGMGDAHLDVILHRLKDKFSVEVEETPLRVPYRTTVRSKGEGLGRHVKQSGGHGQYGICNIRIEPLPRGEGFVYEDKIFGGSIPHQFIPSVEKGVKSAMEQGAGTGFRMIDIKVQLHDGKYHTVDSNDFAFQMAGSLALRDAAEKAGVVVLEPIWQVDVMVPEESTGDIMGDLQKRRGIPEGIETVGGGRQMVRAKVPFGEATHYATDLRSLTGGQGTFSWSFSHYQEVPHDLATKILEAAKEEAHHS